MKAPNSFTAMLARVRDRQAAAAPQQPMETSFNRFADLLESHGLAPATVVDVGIAWGTPWLYDRWPRAKYYLVDPTPQSLATMEQLAKRLDVVVCNFGLGSEPGQLEFNISANHGWSSFYQEVDPVEVLEERTVEVRRYDTVIPADTPQPVLVKIDVQGAELAVLQGMGGGLQETAAIIVEVSTISTLSGAPEFAEVFKFLDDNDFALHDVLATLRRPLDGALAQMDVVFVPKCSPLRADRRWG